MVKDPEAFITGTARDVLVQAEEGGWRRSMSWSWEPSLVTVKKSSAQRLYLCRAGRRSGELLPIGKAYSGLTDAESPS